MAPHSQRNSSLIVLLLCLAGSGIVAFLLVDRTERQLRREMGAMVRGINAALSPEEMR